MIPATITIAHIKRVVAEAYGLRPGQIEGYQRARKVTKPRHICIALCDDITKRTLNEIGTHFGKRDHTTILNSIKVAAERWPEEIAAMRVAIFAAPEPVEKEPAPVVDIVPVPTPPREVIKPVFTPRKVRATPVVAIVPRRQSMTAYLMGDPGAGSARIDRGETSSGRAP